MSDIGSHKISDAELLVAYLDDALDEETRDETAQRLKEEPELQALFEELSEGERPLRTVFDLLLKDAPTERMERMLEEIDHADADDGGIGAMGYAMAAGIALALFVAGVLAGRMSVPAIPDGPAVELAGKGGDHETEAMAEHSGWRQSVAEYLALYERRSFELMPDNREVQTKTLKRLSDATSGDYSLEKLTTDKMQFKRGQLLNFKGKPLLQFFYLYEGAEPVAFCIIENGETDKTPAHERRNGFNIVHWVSGGRAFMLIGKVDAAALTALAATYAGKFG